MLVAVAAALAVVPAGYGQQSAPAEGQNAEGANAAAETLLTPAARLEHYLEQRGLDELLAVHLRQRLKESSGAERVRIAERMGTLFVRLLNEAPDAEHRRAVEAQARDLLKNVAEAPTFELRINLLKVTYLKAQQDVERDRLRLAKPEEVAEAARVLREVGPSFTELAGKLDNRVDAMERREENGREIDPQGLKSELNESRRLRSLARYYAGWSSYYLAVVDKNPAFAQAAMVQFGGLLNAPSGKPATVDRIPAGLLKYEHVARAAVGCALASALRGNNVDALAWLAALDQGNEVSPAAADQLLHAKLIIFAGAGRWSDIEAAVRDRRGGTGGGASIKPLSTEAARLLAVLALEGASTTSILPETRSIMERLAQVALGDLIAVGEAGQVLDLVQRYGTAPVGQQGFMGQYIRGLQIYDKARATHTTAGNADHPTRDNTLVGRYRDAAGLFEQAAASLDAARYSGDRAKALMLRALSLFYAGDLGDAAGVFVAASDSAPTENEKRDALWYAVVALDKAVDNGKPSLATERDRVSILYLQLFPGTENAAKLLLRRSGDGLVSDEDAVRTLLTIAKGEALYDISRRHASSILFRMFRGAPAASRTEAARRFFEVANEIAGADEVALASSAEPPKGLDVRLRQMAEAALAMSPPDLNAASRALDTLERLASKNGVASASYAGEVLFRRLQIHLARGDDAAAEQTLGQLVLAGGGYAPAGDRLMYRRRLDVWRASPGSVAAARALVVVGARVVAQFEAGKNLPSEPQVASVYAQLAEACALLWTSERDVAMRDVAIKLDRSAMEAGVLNDALLRRLGSLAEDAGDVPLALDAWRAMLTGVEADSRAWFEARYQTIRLLMKTDRTRAVEAMGQLKLLHPEYGPEPWNAKLKELDDEMGGVSVTTPEKKGASK
ncbi:MAG: hypothetical protein SFY96_05395 [Planctomycetota bacterium]|nr:hypothetical protein [Planctomycetota bacterium]